MFPVHTQYEARVLPKLALITITAQLTAILFAHHRYELAEGSACLFPYFGAPVTIFGVYTHWVRLWFQA